MLTFGLAFFVANRGWREWAFVPPTLALAASRFAPSPDIVTGLFFAAFLLLSLMWICPPCPPEA